MNQNSGMPSALESVAHLCQKVCLMWGTQELDSFISHLIMDARDGARQGLPMDMAAELFFLSKLNKMRRAIDFSSQLSISEQAAYELVDKGDTERIAMDVWDNPLSNNSGDRPDSQAKRRYARVESRSEGSAVFGMVFQFVTGKYMLILIALVLTVKALWPSLKKVL
jgi:hypothetical protein